MGILGIPVRRNTYILLAAYVLLTLAIAAVGYHHYVEQKAGIETEVRNELAAIADLEVRQVANWRRGRLADAKIIAHTEMMPAVGALLAGRADPKAQGQVRAWLQTLHEVSGYANAILVNSHGKVCLTVGQAGGSEEHYASLTRQVLRSGQVSFTDLHYDNGMKGPHLGLNIPLRSATNGPLEGALLLGIDPDQFLYPLIQSWPTPSQTGETLLVRREGNEVVFLNELRHRKNTALKLRFPLTDRSLPAAKAVRGEEGVVYGMDYRGVPVVAVVRKVPDSPWFLVAKVDTAEIYAPIHQQARWLLLIACSLALAMAAAGAFVWRNLQSRFYQEKYEAELERSKLQAQLQQAQKMESVGRLAGGVAHDFNNLLTIINGYAALLSAQLPKQDPLRDPIAEIAKAGERAAELTQQLLAFSRKQVVEPKVLDLNAIVAEATKMLRRLMGEDIKLLTVLAPSLGRVLADAGQMQQVLMNLAVNARDAMPHGGQLILETANVELDEGYAATHADTKAGPYVLLTVTDSGMGMSEETRQRAFEPFFTTKATGEGTGLGLSTVYGIVKQNGGWIWMYSEPGQGTTFKIYLPRVAEETETPQVARPAPGALHGTETLLVVEDQAEVRKLTIDILKRQGYRVLEAANGGAALLVCMGFPDPIHLMVTDLVMPGMTGGELATRVASLRPAMKVLYISGYPENVLAHQGVLESSVAYLPKPFSPNALAAKVRELLGGG